MEADPPEVRFRLLRLLLLGGLAGLVLAVSLHFTYVLGGSNFRTVVRGEVYRSAQLSGPDLERFVRSHGIRTVVNLRGCCPNLEWYQEEARTSGRLDIAQEDLNFSAMRLPSRKSVRQLIEVLERTEYPLLLHCQQGADRTGLASVMALLLRSGATLDEALHQLSIAGGHVRLARTRHMDRFFDFYRDWLAERGEEHSPPAFRAWAWDHYCPDNGRAGFTLLDEPSESRPGRAVFRLAAKKGPGGLRSAPRTIRVRVRNESRSTWRFHPGRTAGIHGQVYLRDSDHRVVFMRRTGMFHRLVPPGEHVDLDLPIPVLLPGRYELLFDLLDEQHGSFVQLGNDPLVVELEVS